jgi:hypothetical protein
MALSDALSDTEDEIAHWLEPDFSHMYTGEMRAYVEKLLTEVSALRRYYDTQPDREWLERARTRVREAFASPVPTPEKETV